MNPYRIAALSGLPASLAAVSSRHDPGCVPSTLAWLGITR